MTSKIKFVVSHLVELGDAENGPMGLCKEYDGAFETRLDAQKWIDMQTHPQLYSIENWEGSGI
jgi:hypothetical protein